MTREDPWCSSLFYNIMYKYEPLPLTINHLFPHHSITLELRMNLEHRCSQLTSLKLYINSLYITYNLYIEPDNFALSQIKFFKCSGLVDTPVTNIYILSSSYHLCF
jgi:hypothetical protein